MVATVPPTTSLLVTLMMVPPTNSMSERPRSTRLATGNLVAVAGRLRLRTIEYDTLARMIIKIKMSKSLKVEIGPTILWLDSLATSGVTGI
jgi:hypothetical protein